MSESRFEAIETRLAFQEDLLGKLDDALVSQQKQILELREQVRVLGQQLADLEASAPVQEDSRPPHY
ncbi:MAG: SlyX family protein [Pseudomonadales bacterium]|nr:SlyX family protein [Pseudomonadales bacterium]